jgi:hypothetical protein
VVRQPTATERGERRSWGTLARHVAGDKALTVVLALVREHVGDHVDGEQGGRVVIVLQLPKYRRSFCALSFIVVQRVQVVGGDEGVAVGNALMYLRYAGSFPSCCGR